MACIRFPWVQYAVRETIYVCGRREEWLTDKAITYAHVRLKGVYVENDHLTTLEAFAISCNYSGFRICKDIFKGRAIKVWYNLLIFIIRISIRRLAQIVHQNRWQIEFCTLGCKYLNVKCQCFNEKGTVCLRKKYRMVESPSVNFIMEPSVKTYYSYNHLTNVNIILSCLGQIFRCENFIYCRFEEPVEFFVL